MTLEHLDTALGFAVIMLLLSLLITVLVQATMALLGLRGRNLVWGVTRVIEQIDPALESHARAIAEKALRHPAIAPIRRRAATAIRADELIRLLQELAGSSGGPLSDPEKEALKGALAQVVGTTNKLVANVNSWFDTIMDRTTERFVLHARWITVAAAVLFVFLLHIDSLQLLHRLSTDSQFRAGLVAASQATLQRAEDVVALTAERKAVASRAVEAVRAEFGTAPEAARLAEVPGNLVTRQQGEAWLRERLKGVDSSAKFVAAYNKEFDTATETWLGELRGETSEIRGQLQEATFQLVPDPYPPPRAYVDHFQHFVGTLMSALLLSLGAPFWFNVLRELANLRPALAKKVEGDAGP